MRNLAPRPRRRSRRFLYDKTSFWGLKVNLRRVLSDFFITQLEPTFMPIFDHLTYKTLNGIAKGFKRKGGLGFLPFPPLHSREERFLANLDLTGKTVYDVGAANGLLTLFFAAKVGSKGKVLAFEPNPRLAARANENIQLNNLQNVRMIPMALGKLPGVDELYFPASTPGVGSLATNEKKRISRLKDAKRVCVTVESIDHLHEAQGFTAPDLIKIDTQGFEREVLSGAERVINTHKPDLYVEVHSVPPDSWRKTNLGQIISTLSRHGYCIIHVESGQEAKEMNLEDFQSDEHLYCRFIKGGLAKTPEKA